ncbi:MAG TPA: hypothetical protein VLB51_10535, partial [Methylomirabilota bacterium]|nr:hypothetical protein [Methylomirabilota bacterium]
MNQPHWQEQPPLPWAATHRSPKANGSQTWHDPWHRGSTTSASALPASPKTEGKNNTKTTTTTMKAARFHVFMFISHSAFSYNST